MSRLLAYLLKLHVELVDTTITGTRLGLPSTRTYHLDLKEFSQKFGCAHRCVKEVLLVKALEHLKRYGSKAVFKPEFKAILITIDLTQTVLTLEQARRLSPPSKTNQVLGHLQRETESHFELPNYKAAAPLNIKIPDHSGTFMKGDDDGSSK